MNLIQSLGVSGSVSWNDGRRLIKLKKEMKMLLPSLSDRNKEFSYEMEIYFDDEKLKERVNHIVKEKKPCPILMFLKER